MTCNHHHPLHPPVVPPHGHVQHGHRVLVGEAVAGVTGAEEGLVVVAGELGQPWDQLVH